MSLPLNTRRGQGTGAKNQAPTRSRDGVLVGAPGGRDRGNRAGVRGEIMAWAEGSMPPAGPRVTARGWAVRTEKAPGGRRNTELVKAHPTGEVLEREAQTWVPRTTGSWVPGGPSLSPFSVPSSAPQGTRLLSQHTFPAWSITPPTPTHPAAPTPARAAAHCPPPVTALGARSHSPGPSAVQPSPYHDRGHCPKGLTPRGPWAAGTPHVCIWPSPWALTS